VAIVFCGQQARQHRGRRVDIALVERDLRCEIDGIDIVRIALDGAIRGGARVNLVADGEVVVRGAQMACSAIGSRRAECGHQLRRARRAREIAGEVLALEQLLEQRHVLRLERLRRRDGGRVTCARALFVLQHADRHVAERLEQLESLRRILGAGRLPGQQVGGANVIALFRCNLGERV
jgi:hypothetical protein